MVITLQHNQAYKVPCTPSLMQVATANHPVQNAWGDMLFKTKRGRILAEYMYFEDVIVVGDATVKLTIRCPVDGFTS